MALKARLAVSGAVGAGSARGPQGPAGPKGEKGDAGFSPRVTVTPSAAGTVVSITDAQGTKSFEVKNGDGSGDMSSEVYDPAGKMQQVAFEAELSAHTGNAQRHASAAEKAAWNEKSRVTRFSVTLPSDGWSESGDYIAQTVSVVGLRSSYAAPPLVDVSLSGDDAESDKELGTAFARIASLGHAETGSGSFSFSFPASAGVPEANIPISITVFE